MRCGEESLWISFRCEICPLRTYREVWKLQRSIFLNKGHGQVFHAEGIGYVPEVDDKYQFNFVEISINKSNMYLPTAVFEWIFLRVYVGG